jgi:hypothetical protein
MVPTIPGYSAMPEQEFEEEFPSPTGKVRREHPELYGKLLEANAAIGDAGGVLILIYSVFLLTVYAGLWMEWYRRIPALRRMDLGNFWIYALVFLVVLGAMIGHFSLLQRLCYRRHRDEILDLFRASRMSRYRLLADLEGDEAVKEVVGAMKRDRWDRE